jgi:hypothetical protein
LHAPIDRYKDAHLERQQPGTALLTALGADRPIGAVATAKFHDLLPSFCFITEANFLISTKREVNFDWRPPLEGACDLKDAAQRKTEIMSAKTLIANYWRW